MNLVYIATVLVGAFNEWILSDLREPFNLQKGWLLWAMIGFAGALGAIALTGVGLSLFGGENPQREVSIICHAVYSWLIHVENEVVL